MHCSCNCENCSHKKVIDFKTSHDWQRGDSLYIWYCPVCGTQLFEEAPPQYCPNCGEKLGRKNVK